MSHLHSIVLAVAIAACVAKTAPAETGAAPFETQGLVSFTYGGKEFVCNKPVSERELPGGKGWTSKSYEYETPDKRLGVRVTWKFYPDFNAAEYVPELYALGTEKTLPVSQLASFDFSRDDGTKKNHGHTVRVRSLLGDTCNIEMFMPSLGGLKDDIEYALTSWDGKDLGTVKGAELRTRPIKVAEKRGFAMFFYSAARSKNPAHGKSLVDRLAQALPVVESSPAVMERFGAEKARLTAAGTPVEDADVLVAVRFFEFSVEERNGVMVESFQKEEGCHAVTH